MCGGVYVWGVCMWGCVCVEGVCVVWRVCVLCGGYMSVWKGRMCVCEWKGGLLALNPGLTRPDFILQKEEKLTALQGCKIKAE